MAEVKLTIITDASGAITGIKGLEKEYTASTGKMSASSQTFAQKVKGHWLEITAAAYAFDVALNKVMSWAEIGARAEQSETSFKTVAAAYGIAADSMLAKMREVSLGMVDDSALMQRATKALQQGLSQDQIISILQIARGAARTAGVDIKTAFDEITNAAANQMTRGLKQMGIVIDQKKAFDDYAKSIGVATSALTEQEQSQAIANAAIAEGTRQLKAYGDMSLNSAERIQQLKAQHEEIIEMIGKGLVRAAFGAMGVFDALAASILYVYGGLLKIGEGTAWLTSKFGITKAIREEGKKDFESFKSDAQSAFDAATELSEKAADNFIAMTASSDDLGKALKNTAATGVRPLSDAVKQMSETVSEYQRKMALLDPSLSDNQKALLSLKNEYDHLRDSIKGNKDLSESEKRSLEARASAAYSLGKGYTEAAQRAKELASSLQGLIAYQERWTESIKRNTEELIKQNQFEAEFASKDIQNSLDARLAGYALMETIYQNMRGSMLISDETYFAKLNELNQQSLEDTKKALDAQFQLAISALFDELAARKAAGILTVQQEQEILNKLRTLQQGHDADSLKADKDFAGKHIEINQKAADSIKLIWEKDGAAGVIQKTLDDLYKKWSSTWTNIQEMTTRIAEGMQQTVSDVFFDVMDGKLKSLGDYIRSFSNIAKRAMADYASKEVMATVMGKTGIASPQAVKDMQVTANVVNINGKSVAGGGTSNGGGYDPSLGGMGGMENAYNDVLKNIENDPSLAASQEYADKVSEMWYGATKDSTGDLGVLGKAATGLTGVFGSAISSIGGLLSSLLSGAGSALGGLLGIGGKAAGGPVLAYQPYWVGEKGPEIFMPSSSGTIIPNHIATAGHGGNQMTNVSVGINIFHQGAGAEIYDSPEFKSGCRKVVEDYIEAQI